MTIEEFLQVFGRIFGQSSVVGELFDMFDFWTVFLTTQCIFGFD